MSQLLKEKCSSCQKNTKNGRKMASYEVNFKIVKKLKMKQFVFNVIAFVPIKIQTCLAPQNDSQQLSFLKDIYVVGKKITKNGHKMAKLKSSIF